MKVAVTRNPPWVHEVRMVDHRNYVRFEHDGKGVVVLTIVGAGGEAESTVRISIEEFQQVAAMSLRGVLP